MYISSRDIKFFQNIQEELMGNFRQQEISYVIAQNINSMDEDDDIYHEVTKSEIMFSKPIKLMAYVKTNTPEYEVKEFGGRYKNTIEVLLHKEYLDDMGLNVVEGQFFIWGENIYQILMQTGREQQIWGQPETQVYRRFICALK